MAFSYHSKEDATNGQRVQELHDCSGPHRRIRNQALVASDPKPFEYGSASRLILMSEVSEIIIAIVVRQKSSGVVIVLVLFVVI